MFIKTTFSSDEEFNAFSKAHTDADGNAMFFIVKFVIYFNRITGKNEYHLVYSDKTIMRSGMHLRKGVQ